MVRGAAVSLRAMQSKGKRRGGVGAKGSGGMRLRGVVGRRRRSLEANAQSYDVTIECRQVWIDIATYLLDIDFTHA